MIRLTNARLAGVMFLFYIVTSITRMVLFGAGTAAGPASIAQDVSIVRLTAVFMLLMISASLSLAVALYALTRDCDADVAVMALSAWIAEAAINTVATVAMLVLLWVATGAARAIGADAVAANALGILLLKMRGWSAIAGATEFVIGSALYSYLLLRARNIRLMIEGVAAQ